MDQQYEYELDQVTKTLEKAIEMGWLTKNEHIRLEAISHNIIGDLNELRRRQDKSRMIGEMLATLKEYFPEKYALIFENKEI